MPTRALILRWRIIACSLLITAGIPFAGRSVAAPFASRQVSQDQPQPAPRVQFDETEFDFKDIYQYEESSHAFLFHNTGNATLQIGKVRSTCGCAAVLLTKRDIAPGEDGEIKVTFKAGALSGRIIKHVYVDTNDPTQPRLNLKVTVQVKIALDVRPRGVYVGRLTTGETIERFVDLCAVEAPTFRILDVTTSDPALTVGDPVKLEGDECAYRLSIHVGPIAQPGRLNAKVIVRTDLEHARELSIPVYGKIVEGG